MKYNKKYLKTVLDLEQMQLVAHRTNIFVTVAEHN